MIQDDINPVIDFSWFYFVGKTRLGLSFKETGRLTLTMFNRLYGHYKTMWSLEMRLAHQNMTYDEAFQKAQQDEEWL